MNIKQKIPFLLLTSLVGIPGCTRIIEWGKTNLYQGESLDPNFQAVRRYIKSIHAYDQMDLIAQFDVLWLCLEVRKEYNQFLARTTGKTADQEQLLFRAQDIELKNYIMFYVVAPHDIVISEKDSLWHLFLSIDGRHFDPIEIKSIELHNVYKAILGKKYNRFKVCYQLKFDSQDLQGNQLIDATTKQIGLHFRSLHKELSVAWNLEKEALVFVKPESLEADGVNSTLKDTESIRKRKQRG